MKVRGIGLVSGLLMVAACGGSHNSQLSLELGYRESNQLRELSLGIVPRKWRGVPTPWKCGLADMGSECFLGSDRRIAA